MGMLKGMPGRALFFCVFLKNQQGYLSAGLASDRFKPPLFLSNLSIRSAIKSGWQVWLVVVFSVLSSGCKLEISASGSGSGVIQSTTGTIDCDYDGSNTSNDCAQEYVTDITDCDNYDAVDPAKDEWAELPECTLVDPTFTETLVASSNEEPGFAGWQQGCIGAGSCSHTLTTNDVDNDNTYEIEARFEPEASPEPVTYTYNHLGQRKSKTVGNPPDQLTTYFIYDPQGRLISEITNETPPLYKDYIYMEGQLAAIHEKRGSDEQIHYVVPDHRGQPKYMVSRNSSLQHECYVQPFGSVHSEYTVSGLSEHNVRFPGQYHDRESNYHYNYQRYYDPQTGQYTQPDPGGAGLVFNDPQRQVATTMGIQPPQAAPAGYLNHNYNYVDNNPVNWVDPMGEKYELLVGAGVGALGAGIGNVVYQNMTGCSFDVGEFTTVTALGALGGGAFTAAPFVLVPAGTATTMTALAIGESAAMNVFVGIISGIGTGLEDNLDNGHFPGDCPADNTVSATSC